jgi:hypothetical protein
MAFNRRLIAYAALGGAVVAGTYYLADSRGYERGKNEARPQSLEAIQTVVQLPPEGANDSGKRSFSGIRVTTQAGLYGFWKDASGAYIDNQQLGDQLRERTQRINTNNTNITETAVTSLLDAIKNAK